MSDAAATPQPPTRLNFSRRPHRAGDDLALLGLLVAAFGRWPKVEIQVGPLGTPRWKLANTPSRASTASPKSTASSPAACSAGRR
jgi:hypothetical protein